MSKLDLPDVHSLIGDRSIYLDKLVLNTLSLLLFKGAVSREEIEQIIDNSEKKDSEIDTKK